MMITIIIKVFESVFAARCELHNNTKQSVIVNWHRANGFLYRWNVDIDVRGGRNRFEYYGVNSRFKVSLAVPWWTLSCGVMGLPLSHRACFTARDGGKDRFTWESGFFASAILSKNISYIYLYYIYHIVIT